ncbi:MAG: hypothetical protein AAGJ32_11080 [Pseudomonadota bacterium]
MRPHRWPALLTALLAGVGLAWPAGAQTVVDRISFRVPGQVVVWDESGASMRGSQVQFDLAPGTCIGFASNTGVKVRLMGGAATTRLAAVSVGRSARALSTEEAQPFRHLVFGARTAVAPDKPEHQGVLLCIQSAEDPVRPEAATARPPAIVTFDVIETSTAAQP